MSGALAWTLIVGFLAILAGGQAAVVASVRASARSAERALRAELRELRADLLAELRVLATRLDRIERDVERLHARVFDGEKPAA